MAARLLITHRLGSSQGFLAETLIQARLAGTSQHRPARWRRPSQRGALDRRRHRLTIGGAVARGAIAGCLVNRRDLNRHRALKLVMTQLPMVDSSRRALVVRRILRRGAVLGLSTVSLLAGADAAVARTSATVPLAALTDSTPLSVYGSMVAYSQRDAGGAGFRLVLLRDGTPVAGPAATLPVPFDVDLGPGPDGGVAAVYSRCASYPDQRATFDRPVAPGRGCRIYRFDVAGGTERLVAGTHRTGASEYLPAIWGPNVAFARARGAGAGATQLWGRFRSGPARRLAGGPRTSCRTQRGRRVCATGTAAEPLAVDLRGTQLAFSWRYPDLAEGQAHDIRVVRPGRASRLVQRTGGGGLSHPFVAWPTFDGSSLYYANACAGDRSGCVNRHRIYRFDPRTRTRRATGSLDRRALWFARAAGVEYQLVGRDFIEGSCSGDLPGSPASCDLLAAPGA